MASLVVYSPDGSRHSYELSGRHLKVGRSESCDIVLRNDGEVSREHAEIWLDHKGCVIVADHRSKNGTRVDDGEVFHNEARPAYQRVRVGGHEIRITGTPPPCYPEAGVTFVPDAAPQEAGATRFFPSTRGLDLNRQRLALLMSLSERIGGAFERKQLLEQALDACCEALNFERGLIALKTPRGEAELPVTRNVERDATGAYRISRSLINRALLHGERAIVNNPATDLIGNISDSLVRFPICSALCVPILHRDETLGVIYGDRVTGAATYSSADVDFLAAIAQQVGIGLTNLRLFQEYVRSQKMYAELEAARRIQRDLLPAAPLEADTITIDGFNEPSSAVGGDCFDYFALDDGSIAFVIADVTGHGLPAALVMANLQAAVRVALASATPLAELAGGVNRLICQNTSSDVFITGVLGLVEPKAGVIRYVNAGHPPPILVGRALQTQSGESYCLPLGVEPEEKFVVQEIALDGHPGVVMFYTDGLVEAEGADGQLLTVEPVITALRHLPEPSADTVLHRALAVVHDHLGGRKNLDDLTLLAIQYTPA